MDLSRGFGSAQDGRPDRKPGGLGGEQSQLLGSRIRGRRTLDRSPCHDARPKRTRASGLGHHRRAVLARRKTALASPRLPASNGPAPVLGRKRRAAGGDRRPLRRLRRRAVALGRRPSLARGTSRGHCVIGRSSRHLRPEARALPGRASGSRARSQGRGRGGAPGNRRGRRWLSLRRRRDRAPGRRLLSGHATRPRRSCPSLRRAPGAQSLFVYRGLFRPRGQGRRRRSRRRRHLGQGPCARAPELRICRGSMRAA